MPTAVSSLLVINLWHPSLLCNDFFFKALNFLQSIFFFIPKHLVLPQRLFPWHYFNSIVAQCQKCSAGFLAHQCLHSISRCLQFFQKCCWNHVFFASFGTLLSTWPFFNIARMTFTFSTKLLILDVIFL